MPRILEIRNWDAVENTAGDLAIVIPPGPEPVGVVAARGGVDVLTTGAILRLARSEALRGVVLRARTVVVAEADERIVRETLVPVAAERAPVSKEKPHDLHQAA